MEDTRMTESPFKRSYLPGLAWNFPLPEDAYVEDIVRSAASRWPDKIAIEFPECRYSFKELLNYSGRFASGLLSLGVPQDANVGICLPNLPHYPICLAGILMSGARVVNFSPMAAAQEFEHQCRDAEVSTIIYWASAATEALILRMQQAGIIKKAICCDIGDFSALNSGCPATTSRLSTTTPNCNVAFLDLLSNDGEFRAHKRQSPSREVALIQYTGGTTGEPKGAMLSHANISSAVASMNHYGSHYIDYDTEQGLMILPLFHIFGVCMLLAAFANGIPVVLHLRFDAKSTLQDIQQKKIVSMAAVPTMYEALLRHPHFVEYDLSTLQRAYVGGAALSVETRKEFKARTGLDLLEGYGLTETTGIATSQVLAARRVAGTVGLAQPHLLVEIVDLETDEVLPQGSIGEVCISGPTLMAGYWKKPEATAKACRGGKFHTGDIGSIDSDGNLTILDRMKDMIVNGGFKVFPLNVERAIATHPGVQEVAVIGVPDALHGQAVKAFIVARNNEETLSLMQLRAYLADKLASYECPSHLEHLQSLPKTPVGKIAKSQLS